jgi:hypothetical protein
MISSRCFQVFSIANKLKSRLVFNIKCSYSSVSQKNDDKLNILLISGSLRKKSTNTGLLRACVELGHPTIKFQWADIT